MQPHFRYTDEGPANKASHDKMSNEKTSNDKSSDDKTSDDKRPTGYTVTSTGQNFLRKKFDDNKCHGTKHPKGQRALWDKTS